MPDGIILSPRVRVGTPDDVHGAMELAIMGGAENGIIRASPEKLLNDIWPALNLDWGIVGIVGELGQKLEGLVILRITTPWYGDDPVLEERAIFVHPEYRSAKGGRAARLCEFSMKTADRLGLPLIIGILSSQRTAAKVRMYTRFFGEPAGAFWIYGTRTGEAARNTRALDEVDTA